MKKLLTIAMISLAAMAAKADLYLYWTVNVDEASSFGATYAALYGDETALGGVAVGTSDTSYLAVADANGPYYTNYWVKLYDESMAEVALSDRMITYSEIAGSVYDKDITSKPADTEYSFSGFTNGIPEPTSGLMLLLGLAGLALKRKVA